MKRPQLIINGEPVEAGPRWRPPTAPKPEPRPRIFDHLNGEPEDARFSRVAHAMRKSPLWASIPTYEAPVAIAGEIDNDGKLAWLQKRLRGLTDQQLDELADRLAEAIDKKRNQRLGDQR